MTVKRKSYSRHLAHPVTLLSVAADGKENIATMAWVSPVSFDPALLMVAVSPKRFSHDMILESKEFAILVLSHLQKELATIAGTKSGKKENKWELPAFKRLRKSATVISAPVLEEYRAIYECRLMNHITAGDHTIFVGEILHAEANEELNPLILFNRKYFDLGNFISRYP